jgi:transposase
MERLEAKRVKGHTYYYYSKWARVGNRCRRVWQKYLGKLQDIVHAVEGGGPAPAFAEVFQWGLPQAFWQEATRAQLVELIDRHCPKRHQGLTTGQYLAVAALNRAISPCSKRGLWDWFAQTGLVRHLPEACAEGLSSQRFWDHMHKLDATAVAAIWQRLLQGVVRREQLDLSSISYDGTNFYTFIDTFNLRCVLARRGKNKQGRNNLRQVSYALFCCADGHLPLFYEVYEGNRNDSKQFRGVLERFQRFFQELGGQPGSAPETTLIFDKGNNSADNFRLLDQMQLHFVGSVKLDEHPELAAVANSDARFTAAATPGLEGTKSFRVHKVVADRERVLVVTYNQNLFNAQWLTLQKDMERASAKLAAVQHKLQDRAAGLIKGGRAPTVQSVTNQGQTILRRQHLRAVIPLTIGTDAQGIPQLSYTIDAAALQKVAETSLGKTILISNREEWTDDRIIAAYRSQFIIEGVFKGMKDRRTGTWWPLHHWTDAQIKVHGLYCAVAVLLRGLMWRRARQAGLKLSMNRLLSELGAIREVVNIYPANRGQKAERKQAVLSRTSELQQQLLRILGIEKHECTGS